MADSIKQYQHHASVDCHTMSRVNWHVEDIRQIKNQESQNQTASINFSSREDFQTIIDQMVDDGYCSNLVNESTDRYDYKLLILLNLAYQPSSW
jgi:phosphotransferase system IIB component